MASGKCPKCEKTISEFKAEGFLAKHSNLTLKSVAFLCPYCNAILCAGTDPYALVEEIKRAVR